MRLQGAAAAAGTNLFFFLSRPTQLFLKDDKNFLALHFMKHNPEQLYIDMRVYSQAWTMHELYDVHVLMLDVNSTKTGVPQKNHAFIKILYN